MADGVRVVADLEMVGELFGRQERDVADDLLDLRLPRAIQKTLRSDPKAHFRNSVSEWLEFEFHTVKDVAHLVTLAREAWAAAREART